MDDKEGDDDGRQGYDDNEDDLDDKENDLDDWGTILMTQNYTSSIRVGTVLGLN